MSPVKKFRISYEPHPRVTSAPVGVTMTKQSFKEECDINTIMTKYQKSGVLAHFNANQGDYSNLIHDGDYHSHMNFILAANENFSSLPSLIRRKFNNDPAVFLKFAADPDNLDQMIELGLSERTPTTSSDDSPKPPKKAPPETPSTDTVKPPETPFT